MRRRLRADRTPSPSAPTGIATRRRRSSTRPNASPGSATSSQPFRLMRAPELHQCCAKPDVLPSSTAHVPMFDLYYWPTPNGCKVTILLHELDVPYNLVPLDIG